MARLFLFVAVTVLWGASTPFFADYLSLTLERQYPPVSVEETPTADVIVVLGGAVAGVLVQQAVQSVLPVTYYYLVFTLLHVLSKGLMSIRHYGFLANRCRKEKLAKIREGLCQGTG